jgi:hypothetical protein
MTLTPPMLKSANFLAGEVVWQPELLRSLAKSFNNQVAEGRKLSHGKRLTLEKDGASHQQKRGLIRVGR